MGRACGGASNDGHAMSLILEALRRSEAERRRAALPTLLGESASTRPVRPSAWPIALGGLLIGAVLAAAAAWWWGLGRDTPGAEALPAEALPAAPVAVPEGPIEPVPAAAYAAPMPVTTPSAPTSQPVPKAVAPVPAPSPAAAAPAPDLPVSSGTPSPMAPAPGAPAAADTGHGPRDGDLPWSAVAGDALPALRVSMQVYADAPERRFAIIDGQRRREGEALPNGLTLIEIRRDGLRLGWQGRVLWVPR